MMFARRKPLQGRPFRQRSKPLRRKARPRKTAEECRHFARVAKLPCLVSGERPVTIHHVTASIHGGRITRSHKRIVPLAARFHLIQHGPTESVEALGHPGFYRVHGIDLLAEADRLWAETEAAPVDRNPQGGNEVPSRSDESAVTSAMPTAGAQGSDA